MADHKANLISTSGQKKTSYSVTPASRVRVSGVTSFLTALSLKPSHQGDRQHADIPRLLLLLTEKAENISCFT